MTILIFIRDVLLSTLGQMASLFLGIIVFGLLIHFISQLTFKSLGNAFGPGGTYIVAWLGTPVHELGHALFCLVFFHKIEEIQFFKPDKDTGTLGYVYHKWNPKNPWQVLGNFFIGIGPIVIGGGVLFVLFYYLIPGSAGLWDAIISNINNIEKGTSITGYISIFGDATLSIVKQIFTLNNLTAWQFWLFLYLSICVASNIRLSWADFKGSLAGLGCIVIPFLIMNIIFVATGFSTDKYISYSASVLGVTYGLLLLALVMALIGLLFTYSLSALYYRLRYKLILNPFK